MTVTLSRRTLPRATTQDPSLTPNRRGGSAASPSVDHHRRIWGNQLVTCDSAGARKSSDFRLLQLQNLGIPAEHSHAGKAWGCRQDSSAIREENVNWTWQMAHRLKVRAETFALRRDRQPSQTKGNRRGFEKPAGCPVPRGFQGNFP